MNIKSLIGVLLLGTTITSCNDFEDFDKNVNPTFSESMPKGYYESTNSKNQYGVVYTENAKGEDIFYVVGPSPKEDNTITYVISDSISYDKVMGTLTAVTPVDSSYHGFETKTYMSYLSNSEAFPLQMIYKLPHFKDPNKFKTFTFDANVKPSKNYPSANGRWVGETADGTKLEMALKALESDGKTTYTTFSVNGNTEEINYTFENNKGQAKGETCNVTFSYNEKYQMELVYNGSTIIMDRMNTPYKPEEMLPVYECTYIIAFSTVPEIVEAYGWPTAFDTQKTDAVLYQSDKDPSKYMIEPWYQNDGGFYFYCDETTQELTFEPTETGLGFSPSEPVVGFDVKENLGLGKPSIFDKKASPKSYNFNFLFADPTLTKLAGAQVDKLVLNSKIDNEED